MTQPKRLRPSSLPVLHDISFARTQLSGGRSKVTASIECERRGCTLDVDVCRSCERFLRIEMHEAGFVMLCRSRDEGFDADD